MPHLSPMAWMSTLMLLWMMIPLLITIARRCGSLNRLTTPLPMDHLPMTQWPWS